MTGPAPEQRDGLGTQVAATLLDVLVTRCPVIVYVLDEQGRCTYSAGPPLARLGLSADELVGQDVLAFNAADPVAGGNLERALRGEPRSYTWTGEETGTRFEAWLQPVTGQDGTVRGVVGVSVDVSDAWRAEASEHARVLEQQDVLHQLLAVQDAERARISAGLHDDTVQVLAALALRVSTLRRRLPGADASVQSELSAMSRDLSEAGTRLRDVVAGLQPEVLVRAGLAPALQELVSRTFDGSRTRVRVEIRPDGAEPPDAARRVLYEVAVEALGNVRKHAAASLVDVVVERQGGGWAMAVSDDGSGTEVDEHTSAGFGMRAMRQRVVAAGGGIEVVSAPGRGTTVRVDVPEVPPFLRRDEASAAAADVRGALEHVLANVTDAFLAIDTRGRFVHVNRAAAAIFGREAGDLVGKDVWSEFPHMVGHPLQLSYDTARQEQRTVEVEEHYAPADRWFRQRLIPSRSGLTVFLRDVTEQHRTRRRLEDADLGAELAGVWSGALVGDLDVTRAVQDAARALVEVGSVSGVEVLTPSAHVRCGERAPDADEVAVTAGPVELARLAVSWSAGSTSWTASLTGRLAQVLAARLAPGAAPADGQGERPS